MLYSSVAFENIQSNINVSYIQNACTGKVVCTAFISGVGLVSLAGGWTRPLGAQRALHPAAKRSTVQLTAGTN
jgi:hypothetical protein